MSDRKPGYVIGVVLLAVVLLGSAGSLAVAMGWFAYSYRTWPLPGTVGLHRPLRFFSQFHYQSFWQDGFINIRWEETANGNFDCSISSFDPKTGERIRLICRCQAEVASNNSPSVTESGLWKT